MTTKLEAINTILACIKHAPLNSLEGTLSSFAVSAVSMLDSETERAQLKGWDFNTENNYPLQPDVNNIIEIPKNILKVKIPQIYKNQYVIRENKLYDKVNHTFKIPYPIRATVVFGLVFEELPEVVKRYVTMHAAYKFAKRELGSQAVALYTQQDLQEAEADMINYEIDIGNYSLIKEFYTNEIRSSL